MKIYEADSAAEAVVLMDYGVSVITYNQSTGFELTFERTRRIKVLTEAGKRWADFSISLYEEGDRAEDISFFRGVTVNMENGKAVESRLSKDAMFKEKRTRNIEVVKVTMPNVKVGSVIDITYKIRSDFLFNFQDWDFQTMIPVVWSEYRAEIPEYFTYEKYMQGYLVTSVNETSTATGNITLTSFNRNQGNYGVVTGSTAQTDRISYTINKFRWVVANAPAFRDEPYMTTRNDYISRLNFELAIIKMPGQPFKNVTGSWEEINKRFAESSDFLGEVNGNSSLRKIAENVTASATTVPQKIEAIHAYVRNAVAWNGESRTSAEHNLKDVLEGKRGSSAEINLLIASMLEKVNVRVRPILLSTREHGFIREATPAILQFNYSICEASWDDKRMLLDGTNPFLPAGYLPSRCLNGQGMAVSKNGFEWIALKAPAKTRTVVNSELDLSSDGVLSGQVRLEYYGYNAAEQRQKYQSKGDQEYVKSLVGTRPWELTSSEFANARELNEVFKEKHNVVINEHISAAGDVMYMNPFIESQWTSNPFKSETREYPVDFGNAFDEVYMIRLKLPEGYAVDEMPQPKVFVMPANAARYIFSSALNGSVISVTSNLSVNKSLFSTEEYEGLREFCNLVVAKQAEQIVIRKK